MDVMVDIIVDIDAAASNGDLRSLQLAHEAGIPWTVKALHNAVEKGHIHCVRYLHENGAPIGTANAYAAQGGIECLQYFHDAGVMPTDDSAAHNSLIAAVAGRLDCLQYLHDKGYPFDPRCCEMAVEFGHLACLVFLHENGHSWTPDTPNPLYAVMRRDMEDGHVACMQYASRRGCPQPKRYVADFWIHWFNHLNMESLPGVHLHAYMAIHVPNAFVMYERVLREPWCATIIQRGWRRLRMRRRALTALMALRRKHNFHDVRLPLALVNAVVTAVCEGLRCTKGGAWMLTRK